MDSRGLAKIERTNYVLTAILVAFGLIVLGRPYALGLGIGALVGSLNFSLVRHLVVRWTNASEQRRAGVALLFVPKMMVLLGVVFGLLYFVPMSPIFFAIGFSVFLVSIGIESVRFALGGQAISS